MFNYLIRFIVRFFSLEWRWTCDRWILHNKIMFMFFIQFSVDSQLGLQMQKQKTNESVILRPYSIIYLESSSNFFHITITRNTQEMIFITKFMFKFFVRLKVKFLPDQCDQKRPLDKSVEKSWYSIIFFKSVLNSY